MSRALMWFLAITNLGFLGWAVADPFQIGAFVGLSPMGEQAGVELRAMYGGLIGGLGVVNLVGAIRKERLNSAVWATGWAFAGIGAVRSLSCLVLGVAGWQVVFAVSEVAAAVVCFALLRKNEASAYSE